MTLYAALPAKAVGSVLTAANWTSVKDDFDALAKPLRGQATNASGQSIANVSTTTLTLNSTTFLSGMTLSSNALVVPTGGAGIYVVFGGVRFATNATGTRQLFIRKNGINQVMSSSPGHSSPEETGLSCVHAISMAAADTLSLAVYQTSGGALSTVASTAYLTAFILSWA